MAEGQPQTDGQGRRFSPALIALAILVGAVPIAIGVVLASGGGAKPASHASTGPTITPQPLKQTTTLGPAPTAIPSGSGALVAQVMKPTTMLTRPGGHAIGQIGRRTEFGSPQVLWVARHTGKWLGVVSTQTGNGQLGWIPVAATDLSREPFQIDVSLGTRELTVRDGSKLLKRYTVAVGRAAAPTPTGRFAVTDRLATGDPGGPYGCCILALTARSPHAIQGWNGGNRIAIHSTPETESIGQPDSHGCIRLTLAEGRWLMTHVPLGTPTIIRS